LFWNPSSDPQQPNVGFVEKTVAALEKLVAQRQYDIHLICRVCSDAEELQLADLLAGFIGRCEVVYCETQAGKAHIVRHLEPAIHIESDPAVIEMLGANIPLIIRICSSGNANSANNLAKQAPRTSPKRASFSDTPSFSDRRTDSLKDIEKELPKNVELAPSLSTCSLFRSHH